ncbi:zinc-alpha-2-glycoprotein-like [Thamnophis elegans]|uniref:zinc-alpha-2-glycoprotein-like n=1 Tax=Thamnophis elegans TaxID=35005 RepID=UPI0013779E8F|nr:zinc-alpha-2-glycoprotein-like [Thamnophis elegans]
MLMQVALLLFLWAGLGSIMPRGRRGSSRHFLSYSYLVVSESSQRVPQFSYMVNLDDQPIARYNFSTGNMVPLVPWMEVEKANTIVVPEMVFTADLELLSKLSPPTGGLHIWQVTLGCERREDGSKGGFFRYGYNGEDFISFDKETLRWVPAQPKAQKVKEEWEEDPARSGRIEVFLENNCTEWLEKCLSYRNKTEPRAGKVTRKVVNDSLEVLICQAFGFYPKEIQATWTRDGEVCEYETLQRNVTPNSDGTYNVQLSIEIDPKERNRFQCHLEHEGLDKPLVLAWEEETDTTLLFSVPDVIFIILGAVILLLTCFGLNYRGQLHQAMTTCLDHLPLENCCSSSTSTTEDEIQSQGCYGQKTELREGEKRPLKASPDVYSDKVEGAALEISEGPSEEQADEHLAGEEMGETQL